VDSQLIKTPSDKALLTKQETLNKINSETERSIEDRSKEIVSQADRNLTSEQLIEEVAAGYKNRVAAINSNTTIARDEKLAALNKEDQQLLAALNIELKKVESQLQKDIKNEGLKAKQDKLLQIKSDKEAALEQRNKELGESDITTTRPTSEDLILKVAPGYDSRKNKIDNDPGLSVKARLDQLNAEDQKLIAAIDKELKQVDADLKKDPNNVVLKAKQEKLQQIKSVTERAIEKRNKELSESDVTTKGATTEELIAAVAPGYTDRKNTIENNTGLSTKTRIEQLNAEDQKLITAIDKELKQVTSDLKKDSNNRDLKAKQEKLQQIKSDTEAAIEQRNKEIEAGRDTLATTSKESVITQLDPNYEDTKSSITTNSTLSTEEQVEQLNNTDRALISKIDERLNQVEEKLEKDPSDEALLIEKEILTSIKTEKESAITERGKELSSSDPSDLSDEINKLIETVDPVYSKEIESINKNEQLTADEKLAQIQKRDQELLKSVDSKLASLEKQMAKDPENKDLIEQKQDLTVLKSETEARISEREQLIDSKLASELTAENIAEQKSILKAKLDPSYDNKIETARTKEGTELDKKAAELKVEQQMLDKITAEETAIRKILSKDPMNKEAKVRYMVLNDLKEETQNNLDLLNTDINALKAGQPLVTVSAEDKSAKISALAPSYTSVVEAVQSADIAKEEKASQLLEEDKNLLNVAVARLEAARTELKGDPSNRELQKEVKVLEEIVAETKQRIEGHERTISEASQLPELSQTQKEQLIEMVDPQYEEKIRSLESDQAFSETEKLKRRQTADQELLAQIYDRQEKIDDQLTDDPSSKELKEEQRSLTVVADELEKQINERQQEIARMETVTASVSEDEMDLMITQVDPTYNNDVAVIAQLDLTEIERLEKLQLEDRSLLEKIERSTSEKEDALSSDPTNTTLKKELEILKAIRSDLQAAIERRDKQLKGTSTDVVRVNEEQRAEKIAAIDKGYEENRGSIQNNTDLTDAKKAEDLLAIDNQMLEKVTDEKIRIKEELAKDPQNEKLKKELAVTESAQQEIEERVQRDKEEIKSSEQPSDLAAVRMKVITDVLPDYMARKEAIETSIGTEQKKTEDLIKLETELLTKLKAEEKAVKKAFDKDPENKELKQRISAVQELIAMQQNEIDGLKDQQTALAAAAKKETLVKETDASYTADIERLKQSTSVTKNSDLAEREAVHQERVSQQIEENETALTKKEDPKLKAETEILKTELTDSKQREAEFRRGTTTALLDQEAKERFVADLREDLLQGKTGELTAEYSTLDELKQQDQVLAQYESELKKEIASQEKIIEQDPQKASEQAQLTYLKDELQTVQEKRRSVKITLGELEKIAVVEDGVSDERFDDPELKLLGAEEARIDQQLNDPNLSKKERAVLEDQLETIQERKTTKENTLLNEQLKTQERETKSLNAELKSTAAVNEETQLNTRSAIAQQKSLDAKAEQLKNEAAATKVSIEKNYLLDQAVTTQERSNDLAKEAVIENRLQQLEEQNGIESLETKSQLEHKKRRYSIQIGELTKLIQELDEQIPQAKGKEVEALTAERQVKVEERALIQKQLDTVNEQLARQDAKHSEVKPTTDPEAMKQEVSYQEEQEIASSEQYKDYSEKANAALQVEKQIATLEAQLNAERSETKKLVAAELDYPSEENKARVQENVQFVKQMETELQTLKSDLATKQEIAQQALPLNADEAMKMQNLLKRAVEPIQRLAVAAALVPLPASGLEINPNATAPNNMTAAIPVNVKNPTGLVYRVQVGAFAKPIPQDLFKEFNPVSGEKINENGITRYMAGYFNSSNKVVEARNQIRQLGYADAFAIAYCDGKRITLAEARIMEANGTCLPKGENELVMEMAANTAVTMGLADTNKLPKQVTYTYNQAPGAAKAEPIEKHLGLFFTVQVGVFNKPVNATTLYNLTPLMTLRLPNGQIRYSAGIFNSVDEARPKKQEAIERGVKDAFITAYYNGQRITLAEAQQLFTDKGSAILDNNINKPTATTNQTINAQQTGPETSETVEAFVEVEKERVQIVTKKTFEEFPREVLNRYNSHGSFYYDETDKRVKSAIAESKDELPQIYYFKDDVDTLVISDELISSSNVIRVNFTGASLPGDFIDWLLRYNYRREFKQTEETIELRIHNVPDEKLPELEGKLIQFGLSWNKEE
ncbi:MAG: hypothetical protein ACK47F_06075, partial [Flavobacteriales bacterium]